MNPPRIETVVSVVRSPIKKFMKTKSDSEISPSSSTRVVLRKLSSKSKVGTKKILSLEGVMSRSVQVVDLSPPKKDVYLWW